MDQKIAFGFGGILVGAAIVLLLSSTGQYRSMMWGANGSKKQKDQKLKLSQKTLLALRRKK
ncbi:MAG: hypothetical protein UU01_C0020G0011 [Parcubacteria group bacterium GW2011_GWA2_40_37]|nr:MAG: hypothetical protein UU01_C0020G0011 [Parcubacteria group bacterium GW2011_GWA2_40_37]